MRQSLLFLFILIIHSTATAQSSLTVRSDGRADIGDAVSAGNAGSGYKKFVVTNAPPGALITKVEYAVQVSHPKWEELAAAIGLEFTAGNSPRHVLFREGDVVASGLGSKSATTTDFNGRSANNTFYIRVWDNVKGNVGYINDAALKITYQVPPPARAGPPVANAISYSEINVSWDRVDGATSYNLYRSKVNNVSAFKQIATINTNSYLDQGLDSNTQYYYRVQACNETCSDPSVSSQREFTEQSPRISIKTPNSSTLITAGRTITVSWDYDGDDPIKVDWTGIGRQETIVESTTAKSISWRVPTNFTSTATYTLRVYSTREFSNRDEFSFNVSFGCQPPVISSEIALATTGMRLTWVRQTTGGVTGYSLQYREVGNGAWTKVDVGRGSGSTLSYDINQLQPATTYEYRLYTVCDDNLSENATTGSFTTRAESCNAPNNLEAHSINTGGASLRWQNVTGGAPYRIQYRKVNTQSWITINESNNVTVQVLTGLEPDTRYFVRVISACSSEKYAEVSFTTLEEADTRPVVKLVDPHSGSYQIGDDMVIRWTSQRQHHHGIYLYKGGEAPGNQIATLKITDFTSDQGASSYIWPISSTVTDAAGVQHALGGNDYKVKIVIWNEAGETAYEYSSNYISIEAASEDYLTLSQDILNFDSNSGSAEIQVGANLDWTVAGATSWLSVVKRSESLLEVNHQANTSDAIRSADLTVRAGSITKTIKVIQFGGTGANAQASGTIDGMAEQAQIKGPFEVQIQAEDQDGIDALTLVVSQNGQHKDLQLLTSNQPSQTTYNQSAITIDPDSYGFQNGEITLGLWLRDVNGNDNTQPIAVKSVNWERELLNTIEPVVNRVYSHKTEAGEYKLEASTDIEIQVTIDGENLKEDIRVNIEDFELTEKQIDQGFTTLRVKGVFQDIEGLKDGFITYNGDRLHSFSVKVSSSLPREVNPQIDKKLKNQTANKFKLRGYDIIRNSPSISFSEYYDDRIPFEGIEVELLEVTEREDGLQTIEYLITPNISIPNGEVDWLVNAKVVCCDGKIIDRFTVTIYEEKGKISDVSPNRLTFVKGESNSHAELRISTIGRAPIIIEEVSFEGIEGLSVDPTFKLPYEVPAIGEVFIPIVSFSTEAASGKVVIRHSNDQLIDIPVQILDGTYIKIIDPPILNIHNYARTAFLDLIQLRSEADDFSIKIYKGDDLIFEEQVHDRFEESVLITEPLQVGETYDFHVSLRAASGRQLQYRYSFPFDTQSGIKFTIPISYFLVTDHLVNYLGGELKVQDVSLSTSLLLDMFGGESKLTFGYPNIDSFQELTETLSKASNNHSVNTARLGFFSNQLQLLAVYFSEANWYFQNSINDLSDLLKGLVLNYILAKETSIELDTKQSRLFYWQNASISFSKSILDELLEPALYKWFRMFNDNEAEVQFQVQSLVSIFQNIGVEKRSVGQENVLNFNTEQFLYDEFFVDFANTFLRTSALKRFVDQTLFVIPRIHQNTVNYNKSYEEYLDQWQSLTKWTNGEFIRIDWVEIFKNSVNKNKYLQIQKEVYGYLSTILVGTPAGKVFEGGEQAIEGLNSVVSAIAFKKYFKEYKKLPERALTTFNEPPFLNN